MLDMRSGVKMLLPPSARPSLLSALATLCAPPQGLCFTPPPLPGCHLRSVLLRQLDSRRWLWERGVQLTGLLIRHPRLPVSTQIQVLQRIENQKAFNHPFVKHKYTFDSLSLFLPHRQTTQPSISVLLLPPIQFSHPPTSQYIGK